MSSPERPTPHARPDWDDYFVAIARAVAERSDCRRRKVGAVLVDRDHRLVGTGYTGATPQSALLGQNFLKHFDVRMRGDVMEIRPR